MAKITESGPQLMTLQSGSTTLVLDKEAGKATMQRKLWFWSLKPMETSLAEVASIESILALTERPVLMFAPP